ncbi:ribokinase [uncultured Martelella sp.]|uniref:ribokinase n=1 Tax=uncultured Martelella sp. TaxID=392331 RepID=UPI0029C765CF|nr:ribokinase [uncultured Martelella sp.]
MIVNFGSLNADLIYRVRAIPEAGQTISSQHFSLQAGGKGANQAVAAALDGAVVFMAGAVGRDPLAEVALQNLKAFGIDMAGIARVDERTGNAAIMVDAQGDNRIILSAGANALADQALISDEILKRASGVAMQLETPILQVEALLERCRHLGARSIVNLAPAGEIGRDALLAADILVVNEDEAESLAAMLGVDPTARGLSGALGSVVIRTLGGEGAEFCDDGETHFVPARPISPVDTTAAGDCFIGVFAAALDRGMPLKAAVERASLAASICCTRAGSQTSLPKAAETDLIQGLSISHQNVWKEHG